MDLKFYLEDNLNKNIDLVIKDSLKEELKTEVLGSAKYAKSWIYLKDILIHDYFVVDLEIIWDVIKDKIPQLKRVIEKILNQ